MKLSKTRYLVCSYSLLFFLCGVQLAYSRLLRGVDHDSNKQEYPLFQARILDNIYVSCDTECISDVGRSEKNDAIIINLGPSANYTLSFPISNNDVNFSLKIKPGETTKFNVFLQQSGSSSLNSFDDYWEQDDGWQEILIYGETIDTYGGGKAILVLSNIEDYADVTTVKFDSEGLPSIWILVALLIGIFVILPLLIVSIAKRKEIFAKVKELYKELKEHCTPKEKFQWSQGQAPVVPEAPDNQINIFQEHLNFQEANIEDAAGGRQDPDFIATDKKPGQIQVTRCSVCLDELYPGMICRQLYCKHIFHSECIELWLENQLLKNKASCPNCNADMK